MNKMLWKRVLIAAVLLFTIVLVYRCGVRGGSRATTANAQLLAISQALQMFHADTGRFPSQREGLDVLGQAVFRGPYITKDLLHDPWGRPWLYRHSGSGSPTVTTLGADGLQGGTRQNTDLSFTPPVPRVYPASRPATR